MTGLWSVIVPEATTNLITNPSLETGATGWSAYAASSGTGSIARSTDWASRGRASLKIIKNNGLTGFYGAVITPTLTGYASAAADLVFTIDLNISSISGGGVWVELYESSGNKDLTLATASGRITRTLTLSGSPATITCRVYLDDDGTIYIDGAQLEVKAYATTYTDGDQPGCKWTGAEHGSMSTRDAQSRAGGRVINLDNYSTYVEQTPGIGVPDIRQLRDRLPLVDGALFRGTRVDQRTFQLQTTIKSDSRGDLHDDRRLLWNILKPDAVSPRDQAVLLRYTLGGVSVQIPVRYDAGLEWNKVAGFSEEVPIRLVADHPFWKKDTQSAAILNTTQTLTNVNRIVARIDDVWQALGTGMSGSVYDIAVDGPRGLVYAVGGFLTAGGVTVTRVAKWDRAAQTWSAMASGVDNTCYTVAVAADGTVYIGGLFTVTAVRVAYWNGSAWATLGTGGANGTVYSLKIGPDGLLYAAGAFTTIGGVSANNVATWDGTTWAALSTGPGGAASAITFDKSGNLYVAANATVMKWDGSNWSDIGADLTAAPDGLAYGQDGYLYAVGNFAAAYDFAVRYNGSSWERLGYGLNARARGIHVTPEGVIIVGGNFTSDGNGIPLSHQAIWNGATFAPYDIDLPSGSYNQWCADVYNDELYIGHDANGSATAADSTTVTNDGDCTAYPKIVISRSGGDGASVRYIKNKTTGATLWFNYDLLDGETLTIDCTPGSRRIYSSFFGEVYRAMLPGSDFGTFGLQPGDNEIYTYVEEDNSPTVEAYMIWYDTFWSADGVGA